MKHTKITTWGTLLALVALLTAGSCRRPLLRRRWPERAPTTRSRSPATGSPYSRAKATGTPLTTRATHHRSRYAWKPHRRTARPLPCGRRRRSIAGAWDWRPIPSAAARPIPPLVQALVWSGNFNTAGTYYVVVEYRTNPAGTSYYLLEVSGDGVLDPGTKAAAEAAKAAAPAETRLPPRPSDPAATEPTGKLVFQTTMGGNFYTVNADGSNLQRITDGMDATWSPDGEQIAFTRWR